LQNDPIAEIPLLLPKHGQPSRVWVLVNRASTRRRRLAPTRTGKGIEMLWTILVIVAIVLVVMAVFGRGRFSRR
jgi:hypothetical protein